MKHICASKVAPLRWHGDANTGHLEMLDQTKLPTQLSYISCRSPEAVHEGIRQLRVRGAPAIGLAGAYGLVLASQKLTGPNEASFNSQLEEQARWINSSRPTAVNLSWALARLLRVNDLSPSEASLSSRRSRLLLEATAIACEDAAMCQAMGKNGLKLIPKGAGILTHCNTGILATAGTGTALAVIYEAHRTGLNISVFADETRPLLQGARLTAWELQEAGVPVTLLCDSMAALLMNTGKIQVVLVGADRIAANGDTANKVGTYSLAVLAKHHSIPFYVVAPTSSFDLSIPDGSYIPIEQRSQEEVSYAMGHRIAPEGVDIFNPAFDVTPNNLISAIVTEVGILSPVTPQLIQKNLADSWQPGLKSIEPSLK